MNLKGKLLKDNNNVYEIVDFELLESANGYMIKCGRSIHDENQGYKEQFKFNGFRYYIVKISTCLDKNNHIDDFEFTDYIKNKTKELWKNVAKKDIESVGQAFSLKREETTSRDAYIKTFGEMAFNELYQELYKELDTK